MKRQRLRCGYHRSTVAYPCEAKRLCHVDDRFEMETPTQCSTHCQMARYRRHCSCCTLVHLIPRIWPPSTRRSTVTLAAETATQRVVNALAIAIAIARCAGSAADETTERGSVVFRRRRHLAELSVWWGEEHGRVSVLQGSRLRACPASVRIQEHRTAAPHRPITAERHFLLCACRVFS